MKKSKIKLISLFIICITIIAIDQLSKALIIGKQIAIIPGFLNLTYTKNLGMAFGVGSSNSILAIVLSAIVIIAIITYLVYNKNRINMFKISCLAIILSGAISNLIDRFFRGYVVDFIDINLFDFPHFNIADISIVICIILLILVVIKDVFYEDVKE